jgi:hypothetical protein
MPTQARAQARTVNESCRKPFDISKTARRLFNVLLSSFSRSDKAPVPLIAFRFASITRFSRGQEGMPMFTRRYVIAVLLGSLAPG